MQLLGLDATCWEVFNPSSDYHIHDDYDDDNDDYNYHNDNDNAGLVPTQWELYLSTSFDILKLFVTPLPMRWTIKEQTIQNLIASWMQDDW